MSDPALPITEELLWLYELSLTLGQSLDPHATARSFLKTLTARRNLTGGAIWWREEGSDELSLLDALPRAQTAATPLALTNPVWLLSRSGQPRVLRNGEEDFAATGCAGSETEQSCALYPLGDSGVLLMRSAAVDVFTPRMLGQMRAVTSKLATALQGGLAHLRLQRSEAALREGEERLRTILDNVDGYIYLKDPQGRYLFANQAVRDLWRVGMDDIAGKGDESFFDAATTDNIRRNDRRVLEQGETLRAEETNTVPLTGRTATYQTTKLPLRRADGTVYALCGISIDITLRKQAEAELEQHRQHLEDLVRERTYALLETEARASHILQSSADGLFGVDREGRITFVNRAARELLGYATEQLIGQSAHALFHHSRNDGSPFSRQDCPILQALGRGEERRSDEEMYWHADGHGIPVMYAIHPMHRNGVVTGAVVSFVDMSAQRAAAQAREQALIAAENLARIKSEFLANMSHEIRTPLNGVLGFALIGQRHADNPAKARNAFDRILASGNLLLGVINEVLDFSKIEAGKLQIDAVEMMPAQALQHAVELVADRARARGLSLDTALAPNLPERCLSDPLRLGQVLLNLLSNAIKFTEAGRITLSAGREGERLVFSVADTGIGITEDQMPRLFAPFQQADSSTTRKFGGTGLGLAISKRIIELMGGDITVESALGQGSRFTFHLPYTPVVDLRAQETPAPGAPAQPPGKALAGLSILVAEDVEVNQIVLEENLVHDGARVTLAGNGREAVERVLQDGADAYDLVLMDIQMPVMNGFEATRRIHEMDPTLPVIGQTAHAFAEEREKCLAVGMVDHIAKPINPDELVRLVRQHARRR